MKKIIIAILILIVICTMIFIFIYKPLEKKYVVESITTECNADMTDINHMFLNSTSTIKKDVITVKNGNQLRLVLELKEQNKTQFEDWTYAYTENGIKIIYKNEITICLVKK